MSLFGSLNIGINGLNAQSTKLDAIANNIANVNTNGYKANETSFEQLIYDSSGNNFNIKGNAQPDVGYSPSGVSATVRTRADKQGEVLGTTVNTNLAITGNGFFAVRQQPTTGAGILYTREGSFTPDKSGNLVNVSGDYLQGWKLDATGKLTAGLDATSVSYSTGAAALQTVNVNNLTEAAVPTTTASIKGNLKSSEPVYSGTPAYDATLPTADMASGAIPADFYNTVSLVDSKGVAHDVRVGFLKTATNTWAVEIYPPNAANVSGTNPQIAAGTITFNGADGTPASISPSLQTTIATTFANGGTTSVAFSFGTAGAPFGTPNATAIGRSDGLTQLDTNFSSNYTANGTTAASLSSINITSDGTVQGTFANGTVQNFYKIPIADFRDANTLNPLTDDVFTRTTQSGTPTFQQSGGTAGKINTSALESSNVDLSQQLTDLIIAQRAYQFNSKIASTTDSMLQTLTTNFGAT